MYEESQENQSHSPSENINKITIDEPGQRIDLPGYIIKQLQDFWPNFRRRLPFFGGHPVSITRLSCNDIFAQLNPLRQSPYLACQKTDGVRYILIVARVLKVDIQTKHVQNNDKTAVQCYLVSRQGQGRLVSYVVDINVSYDLEPASSQMQNGRKFIIQVLDGQLVNEKQDKPRYLIFDGLIHLGRNICQQPLKERLECIGNFLRCCDMMGSSLVPRQIDIRMKDFFRLTCRKFNMVEFMMKKYIKCLTHENDGLIFNHEQKQYVLGGTNIGYIKWKPAHLNTVDFQIIPNINLEDRYGRRVLDLYLATQDQELDRYVRQFYAFTIVSEQDFRTINDTYQQALYKAHENQGNQQHMVINEFAGAIIAECRYDITKTDERRILGQLFRQSDEDLKRQIMRQGDEKKDQQFIKELKKQVYDKCWKVYKVRIDKSLPNNCEVARKIQESIRDGITQEQLIKKNKQLNEISEGRQ